MTPSSSDKNDQDMRILALNTVLHRVLHETHTKSELRDEEYILNSLEFKQAVAKARKALGLHSVNKELQEAYDSTDMIIGTLHYNEHKGTKMSDDDYDSHQDFMYRVIKDALRDSGLSRNWGAYMKDYIAFQKPPTEKFIYIPKDIEVIDFNNDKEITIKLRPGLRYEDYRKSWGAFKKILGSGNRLNKSYGDKDLTLNMLKDHKNGMSYKEITQKYYPNTDPIFNLAKVKKAVQRANLRHYRDI